MGLKHTPGESSIKMACDCSSNHLVTGDSGGAIQMWGITMAADESGFYLEHLCHWQAGQGRITSLEFIEVSFVGWCLSNGSITLNYSRKDN